jgi:Tol biopolymer transport system component
MKRFPLFALLVLVLIGAAVGLYLWQQPRLLEFSPQDGEMDVRAGSALTLTFSQPMQPESVYEHLSIFPRTEGEFAWQGNTLVFTPNEPWINGRTIRVELRKGARSAGLIPLNTTLDYERRFTIGAPRLAYLYPANGSPNIYVYSPLTGEIEQITESGGVLDFDVDMGANMLYFSQRSGQRGSRIFRMPLGGSDELGTETILECVDALCQGVKVSPAGKYLAYERTAFVGGDGPAYPQVWVLALAGDGRGANGVPYRVGDPLHQTTTPHWSPDGWLTYYDYADEAFVVLDLQGEEEIMLPNQTAEPGDWHPDGDRYIVPEITFVQLEDPGEDLLQEIGSSHLILYQVSDGTSVDLTVLDTLEDTAPLFSPDGSQIAFARKYLTVEQWTPGRQVWLMGLNGIDMVQLTNEPYYNHYSFSWNPAGETLAYVRFNQVALIEPPEIWVIDPGTSQASLVIEGGYAPQWIP